MSIDNTRLARGCCRTRVAPAPATPHRARAASSTPGDGGFAGWNIHPDTGWVGVILGNDDDVPFQEIIQREMRAILG